MNISRLVTNKITVALVSMLLLAGVVWLITTRFKSAEIPQGNDRFGLAFISSPDDLADEARYEGALAAGARWDRWPLYWHWIAGSDYSGSHDGKPHDYDALVIEEIARGIKPLVILMGTPPEEAARIDTTATFGQTDVELPLRVNPLNISRATLPPSSLNAPIFQDGTDEPGADKKINPDNTWAMFVFNSVERYRPGGVLAKQQNWTDDAGVQHWEVWNEPDFELFWGGTVEEYYRLLEVAYKSIKTADPEAMVLLGGLAFYEKPNWLGQFLRQTDEADPQLYFDIFSMHHYWSVYGSERRMIEVRALLNAYDLDHVPIWMTESGLSVWDDYPATDHDVDPDTPWRGTMAEQANYVIQHSALALYHGIEKYFHFMLHDDCGDGPSTAYGLRQNFSPHPCSQAQGQPRPAYAAYRLAAAQFQDLQPLWRQQTADQDRIAFFRPSDQSRVTVMWSTQGVTTTATISPTGPAAKLYWIEPSRISDKDEFLKMSDPTIADGHYTLTLPPATNRNSADPYDTRYHIGGQPYILVEEDLRPPRSTITKLLPIGPASFLVSWHGQDDGSGIAGYDVWVGQDNGPLEPWLSDATFTQAEYNGEAGHTYRFAVRARDQANNEETTPTESQASTRAISTTTVAGIVLDPYGNAMAGAKVLVQSGDLQRTITTDSDGTWPATLLPPGEYTLYAEAAGYAPWSAPRSVHLEEPSDILLTLAPLENAIVSGDFEQNDVWNYWDWAGQVDLFFVAFDGQFSARLGRGSGEKVECPSSSSSGQRWSIQQQLTIPDNGDPTLAFVHHISTPQPAANTAWLEVMLHSEGEWHQLVPPGDMGQPSEWALAAIDLSAWRGQSAELKFQVVRCSEQPFTVTLDRISVGNGQF